MFYRFICNVAIFLLFVPYVIAESVPLIWDENPEPDVSSYKVYYGTTPEELNESKVFETNSGSIDLPNGVIHYAVVTAINTSGLESLPSKILAFQVGVPVKPGAPGGFRVKVETRVAIEISSDFKEWHEINSVYTGRLFVRLAGKTIELPVSP